MRTKIEIKWINAVEIRDYHKKNQMYNRIKLCLYLNSALHKHEPQWRLFFRRASCLFVEKWIPMLPLHVAQ